VPCVLDDQAQVRVTREVDSELYLRNVGNIDSVLWIAADGALGLGSDVLGLTGAALKDGPEISGRIRAEEFGVGGIADDIGALDLIFRAPFGVVTRSTQRLGRDESLAEKMIEDVPHNIRRPVRVARERFARCSCVPVGPIRNRTTLEREVGCVIGRGLIARYRIDHIIRQLLPFCILERSACCLRLGDDGDGRLNVCDSRSRRIELGGKPDPEKDDGYA
jgi:hypothetical protein